MTDKYKIMCGCESCILAKVIQSGLNKYMLSLIQRLETGEKKTQWKVTGKKFITIKRIFIQIQKIHYFKYSVLLLKSFAYRTWNICFKDAKYAKNIRWSNMKIRSIAVILIYNFMILLFNWNVVYMVYLKVMIKMSKLCWYALQAHTQKKRSREKNTSYLRNHWRSLSKRTIHQC